MSKKDNKEVSYNALSDLVFNPFADQVSQTDTLWKNTRWYLISNFRQLLSELYVENAIVKNYVDVVIEDAFSKGIEIFCDEIEKDELQKIYDFIEEKEIIKKIMQALKWMRLYGGAGIIVVVPEKTELPLKQENLYKKFLDFKSCDMWELFYDKQNVEEPLPFPTSQDFYFSYYKYKLHASKVLILKGQEAPSFIRPRLRGWGLSVVENVIQSINKYIKAGNIIFEILDELKLDIYKINNLNQALISSQGTQKIAERIKIANQMKNFLNALVMDSQDDFLTKTLSLAGFPEIIKEFRIQIASDLRIPLTKLFGLSASGFNSGEDDIENYNLMVESEVRSKAKPLVYQIIKIIFYNLFGFESKSLRIKFPSLRILSSEQEENIKNSQLNRIMLLYEKGLISTEKCKEMINSLGLVPVSLEENSEVFEKVEEGEEGEEGEEIEEREEREEKKENSLFFDFFRK